jgi:hypothetical protein
MSGVNRREFSITDTKLFQDYMDLLVNPLVFFKGLS